MKQPCRKICRCGLYSGKEIYTHGLHHRHCFIQIADVWRELKLWGARFYGVVSCKDFGRNLNFRVKFSVRHVGIYYAAHGIQEFTACQMHKIVGGRDTARITLGNLTTLPDIPVYIYVAASGAFGVQPLGLRRLNLLSHYAASHYTHRTLHSNTETRSMPLSVAILMLRISGTLPVIHCN